ncbi:MAG: MFS transporter, partial [Candidatus Tectomicrobia bacterium]
MAIIMGTAIGSVLLAALKDRLELIGVLLVAVAVAGAVTSLSIPHAPPSGSRKTFHLNPWAEITRGLKRLYGERPMWLSVVGIAYFWFLGALLQMDLIMLGKDTLGADDLHVGLLQTFLAMGIGVGSVAAGRLSGDKVELGLVPLGALGMGVFALLLAAASPSYPWIAAALSLLGFSGGLFIVPLHAFVQHRSGADEKGRVLATSNFLSTGGILLASAAFWVCRNLLQLPPDQIILIFGCVTLLGTAYVLRLLPDFLVRFIVWMLTHTVYRIRIVGQQHVPLRGPALLVCNHVSFVDGFLVGACVQRFIRFMIYRGYYNHKLLNGFFRLGRAIPIAGGNPQEVQVSLEQARQELSQGHVVCIFAEGAISRTGNLLPFKRGFERIMEGLDVPIIPVHLDRVWGSIFSFKDRHFWQKWPGRLPYPVTVSFGEPLSPATTAEQARQAIMELGCAAVDHRRARHDLLHRRFIATAKRRWSRFCMADSTGQELTYGKTLVGSLLLARWLRQQRPHDTMVGLLLPASVGGALANIAVLLSGKTPVNLNFTAGREAMTAAIAQCGIQTVLTSRQFLRKAQIDDLDGMVDVEDVLQQTTPLQKVVTALTARLLPCRLLQRLYTPRGQCSKDLATVIFSSGSTGTPKGIMLSHHNILSNLEAMEQVFAFTPHDRMMGVLPLFHAFGFTVTFWFPLIIGAGVIYHPNPTDAKIIGEMVQSYNATILLSTPTFCSMYLRQCPA